MIKEKDKVIFDLDDFCESNNALDVLINLKKEIPDLKLNAFTIIGKCGEKFLKHIKENFGWIDMIPHGLYHESPRECVNWNYTKSALYLTEANKLELTKGFKAPGWLISDDMYLALTDMGYWVADQSYNNKRRPKNLKAYVLEEYNSIHGHIGHLGGYNPNEINIIKDFVLNNYKDKKFEFIKNII